MKRIVMRIIGFIFLMIGLPIILFFPAFNSARSYREGQHKPDIQEYNRSHTLDLRVCIPAGIMVGVGATLVVAGFMGGKKKEE